MTTSSASVALVISHPGHELRVHHWMECTGPTVFVLTDGSGHTGRSRLPTTERILDHTGARAGSIFGPYTDRHLYAAMLMGDVALFTSLAATLADAFVDAKTTLVACDAEEGYNPSHDMCRYLTASAVRMAQQQGATIDAVDFLLVGTPTDCPEDLRPRAHWLTLDEPALDRKIVAARRYAEIANDVDTALRTYGREAFGTECLRPLAEIDLTVASRAVPFYERHGAQQVAAGHYDQVLRFADHVRPIAVALRDLHPATV